MSTLFPTSLDTLTNPTASSSMQTVSHAAQHIAANDAITALETKVGANSSAVTSTHDYKLSGVTGTDKAASKTGTETLTNKTLTSPAINGATIATSTISGAANVMTLGSDATGDIYYRSSGTNLTRLGIGGTSTVLTVVGGLPSWQAPAVSYWNVAPEIFGSYSTGGTNFQLPGTGYSDNTQLAKVFNSSTSFSFSSSIVSGGAQSRQTTTDWASSANVNSSVTLGAFVYVLLRDISSNFRVYRFASNNLAAGGTLMTISGQAFSTTGGNGVVMGCDGTNFYFNYKGGNSANDYVVSKYSLSGTTLTYVSDITCGATLNTANNFVTIDSSTNIWVWGSVDGKIRKFNNAGTLLTTTQTGYGTPTGFFDWAGIPYIDVRFDNNTAANHFAQRITL